MSKLYTCRACSAAAPLKTFMVREMMMGSREEFLYFECSSCGSIQITKAPPDMQKYYPLNYPSLVEQFESAPDGGESFLKRYLRLKRGEYLAGAVSPLGLLANIIRPAEKHLADTLAWFRKKRIHRGMRILDVGCGRGLLLERLSQSGFGDLTGIDPYIDGDIVLPGGIKIFKKRMRDIDMKFDVIMLHHSLEHMDDPALAFRDISRLLNRSGHLLIRTPIAQSYASKHYGRDWVQLDVPRHLCIFSVKGIKSLAERSAFTVEEVLFDSTEFQFMGSEQYIKDIPLLDKRSFFVDRSGGIFTKPEIARFKARAQALNRQGMGDQAAICMTR